MARVRDVVYYEAALRSVAFCDEVLVVDGGYTAQ